MYLVCTLRLSTTDPWMSALYCGLMPMIIRVEGCEQRQFYPPYDWSCDSSAFSVLAVDSPTSIRWLSFHLFTSMLLTGSSKMSICQVKVMCKHMCGGFRFRSVFEWGSCILQLAGNPVLWGSLWKGESLQKCPRNTLQTHFLMGVKREMKIGQNWIILKTMFFLFRATI